MSAKNKKKSSVFEKKNLLVMVTAAAFVAAVAFAMSMLLPSDEKENTFDSTAWDEAVQEAESSLNKKIDESETGLTSVYKEDAVATAAEAYPVNAEESAKAPEEEKTNTAAETQSAAGYTAPVSGAVLNDYSGEELVYSETMQDWRTHNGIDFAAEEGTDVLAAADGTIEAITDNSMMGTTVILLHGNGVRTIYSNLDSNLPIDIGTNVTAGTIIGKIGSTAALEASEPPHLHFEMSLNEETVNPHDYLNE